MTGAPGLAGPLSAPEPSTASALVVATIGIGLLVASVLAYLLLQAALGASSDRRGRALTGAVAAAAFALVYVFAVPRVLALAGVDQPGLVALLQAAACTAALAWWVWDQRRVARGPGGEIVPWTLPFGTPERIQRSGPAQLEGSAAPPPVAGVDDSVTSVVIVGGGVAGRTAAERVRRLHPGCDVVVLGGEPDASDNGTAVKALSAQAVAVDLESHKVTLDTGDRLAYSRLILATGASSRQPPIEGLPLPGAHPVHSAEDIGAARSAAERHPDLRNVVIVGAGPVGIQAAEALHGSGAQVTLVDRDPWPLSGAADARAGALIQAELSTLGVAVETGVTVDQVYGVSRVAAVGLSDGRQLPCDLLLLCTGAVPNVELARAAGLAVNRGVVVDATMRTSHRDVFAAGDVAEFGNGVSGASYTAVEEAVVAAEQAVARNPSAARRLRPGLPVTRLYLPGLHVVCVGHAEPDSSDRAVVMFDEPATRQYRKIIVAADGTVRGGIAVNDPDAEAAIEAAAAGGTDLRPLLNEARTRELITLAPAVPHPSPGQQRKIAWGAGSGIAAVFLATVAGVALVTASVTDPGPTVAPSPSAGPTTPEPATGAQPTGPTDPRVAEILRHSRITWSPEARQTLLAGGADTRLLALLVALAADHQITISALPRVAGAESGSVRRAVAISALDGAPLTVPSALDLATWFNAQQSPYRPAAVLVSAGKEPALYVALDGSATDRPAPNRPAPP